MKKSHSTATRPLGLRSETIRRLGHDDLQLAAGGNEAPPTHTTTLPTTTTTTRMPRPRA